MSGNGVAATVEFSWDIEGLPGPSPQVREYVESELRRSEPDVPLWVPIWPPENTWKGEVVLAWASWPRRGLREIQLPPAFITEEMS